LTTIFKAEKKEGLADLMITKSAEPQLLSAEQVPGIRFLPAGLSSEKSLHTMLKPTNVTTLLERYKGTDIVLVAGPATAYPETLSSWWRTYADVEARIIGFRFCLMKINKPV
jgi:hypothetical protein